LGPITACFLQESEVWLAMPEDMTSNIKDVNSLLRSQHLSNNAVVSDTPISKRIAVI